MIRRIIAVFAAVLLLTGLAACGSDDTKTEPTPDPTPTEQLTPEVEAARAVIERHEEIMSQFAEINEAELEEVAAGIVLEQDRWAANKYKTEGTFRTIVGDPVVTYSEEKVNLEGDPPSIVIRSCEDRSSYDVVDPDGNSTKNPDAKERWHRRWLVSNRVEGLPADGWRIEEIVELEDIPC